MPDAQTTVRFAARFLWPTTNWQAQSYLGMLSFWNIIYSLVVTIVLLDTITLRAIFSWETAQTWNGSWTVLISALESSHVSQHPTEGLIKFHQITQPVAFIRGIKKPEVQEEWEPTCSKLLRKPQKKKRKTKRLQVVKITSKQSRSATRENTFAKVRWVDPFLQKRMRKVRPDWLNLGPHRRPPGCKHWLWMKM